MLRSESGEGHGGGRRDSQGRGSGKRGRDGGRQEGSRRGSGTKRGGRKRQSGAAEGGSPFRQRGCAQRCEEERTVTEMCYGAERHASLPGESAEQPYVNKDRMEEFGALHRAVAVRRKGDWSLKNER
jgi:hypothetical protein